MKILAAFFAFVITTLTLHAAPDTAFGKAKAAYEASDYAESVYELRELAAKGEFSHGALHNLGNAEWKVNRAGYAILAWERALALDPSSANTAANLRFARHQAHLDEPTLAWHERYAGWLPATVWIVIASAALWLGVILLCGPRVLGWHRADWHQGVAALLFAVFLLAVPALFGLSQRSDLGVVLDDETSLLLTPTRHAEPISQSKLPAGEVARIEEERGEYLYVRADGDRAGWIPSRSFGRIWP